MTADASVTKIAPAKINLTLHVTGQRSDGYHTLDSLVTFAEIGDRITCRRSETLSLTVTGPFAKDVPTDTNLVLDAARLMGVTADITLEKNLPVASGIGGGSADAAATLHALSDLYNRPLPDLDAQLSLGADVPVCVHGGVLRMSGIGDRIEVLHQHPLTIPMVLVNPGVSVSTPEVFTALARKDNPPMPDDTPTLFDDAFLDWLFAQRNDLQEPALHIAPRIEDVLSALRDTGGFARMSGSGATCFALYPDERDAARAVADIAAAYPEWWCVAGVT